MNLLKLIQFLRDRLKTVIWICYAVLALVVVPIFIVSACPDLTVKLLILLPTKPRVAHRSSQSRSSPTYLATEEKRPGLLAAALMPS